MGTILSNADAEALILDVRAGRCAARAVIDGGDGGFMLFPTAVVVDRPGRGQLVFPLHIDLEPGSLCRCDGSASLGAVVDGVEVAGTFSWTIAEGARVTAPPASYRFRGSGRPVPPPSWTAQLPASMVLRPRTPGQLRRDQARLVRQGRTAEHWLLVLTQRVMAASCRGPLGRALAAHPLVQDADLVQRGLQAASRLLPVYASPARPPRSWLGMIHLDARRDMFRELAQLDWLPRELGEVVDRARAAGIGLHADASDTLAALVDASIEAGLPVPRLSARQVQVALSAPEVVSLDAPPAPRHGVHPPGSAIVETDPALGAVEDEPGRAAAAVAALVRRDPQTIVGAFMGDPSAVKTVAEAVIVSLRRPGERATATRRRCRDRFLATGALFSAGEFSAEDASAQFPGRVTRDLSALDAALCSTLGIDPSERRPSAEASAAAR